MADFAHLLEIRGLHTHFSTERGVLRAVDGVDLAVERRDVLGVVGESGCGKTMTARSILRLVPYPGTIVAGEVLLEGRDLLGACRIGITEQATGCRGGRRGRWRLHAADAVTDRWMVPPGARNRATKK